ncbi:DEKNAAC102447 [Brettanomyces naardenensis]|uniref:histone acetyltransferase n=1 Tax=Brettanomyces naardenensis TaxID=13370 RepID=A0A448YL15_BRENA|nr:DEKNAAC102447 [Brettanomyces naardenensis]
MGKDHEPFVSETDRGLHILVERARGNKGYGMPVMVKGAIFKPSERLLSDPSRHSTRLILFTRSEAQYLFPNSSKNRGKHILSDSGLLKWWLKNVEVILGSGVFGEVQKRKLNILNADQNEVSRYFPSKESGWQVGDVYSDGKGLNEVAVYHIPLLPDDPKGRFLEHLVVENRIKKVRLRQFWTELSIRQEFRLGITVGLIGIEGQSNENDCIDSGVHKFKRAEFNKIKDLIVDIDYSDPLDYRNAHKQLEERELDLLEIKGVASTSHIAPSPHSLVPTLLPTRSKRGLSEVHVISTLVKRKVKK